MYTNICADKTKQNCKSSFTPDFSSIQLLFCTLFTVNGTLCRVHCLLYTVHCEVYTVYCTRYTVKCTLFTVQCTLYCTRYTVYCTRYTVQCTLFTIHGTLCRVHCLLYTVHCLLYTVQCTLFTVHGTLCNVHCLLYTVHCAVYTVYCTPYTVQCTTYIFTCVLKQASENPRRKLVNIARYWLDSEHINILILQVIWFGFWICRYLNILQDIGWFSRGGLNFFPRGARTGHPRAPLRLPLIFHDIGPDSYVLPF